MDPIGRGFTHTRDHRLEVSRDGMYLDYLAAKMGRTYLHPREAFFYTSFYVNYAHVTMWAPHYKLVVSRKP